MKITFNERFFRDHQKEAAALKAKVGMIPQLPNDTRWTSQRACFKTFIDKRPKYIEINDEFELQANISSMIRSTLLCQGYVESA